jgi:hypothetical protein
MARKTITVDTPEWVDRPVTTLRKWNAGEWLRYQAETNLLLKNLSESECQVLAHARIIAWSAVTESGEWVYSRPDYAAIESAAASKTLMEALKPYTDILEEDAGLVRRLAYAAIDFQDVWDAKKEAIAKN